MNNQTDKYILAKKRLAKFMGFAVLLVSFKFSAAGFDFKTHDALFIGWILALAVTTAQLIFNTQVRKLNWTIIVVGVISYAYSIWTNIIGFYSYRGATEIVLGFDTQTMISVFGGAFLDIFPEMALAWAYGAGSDGDLVGNLLEISQGSMEPQNPNDMIMPAIGKVPDTGYPINEILKQLPKKYNSPPKTWNNHANPKR